MFGHDADVDSDSGLDQSWKRQDTRQEDIRVFMPASSHVATGPTSSSNVHLRECLILSGDSPRSNAQQDSPNPKQAMGRTQVKDCRSLHGTGGDPGEYDGTHASSPPLYSQVSLLIL